MKLRALLLGLALTALSTVSAHAATVAFSPDSLNGPADYQPNIPVTLGLVFTANADVNVTALGFYDIPNLTDPEDVGLFDSSGNLLASVTVNVGSPLVDGYHFLPISPVALTEGDTYTVAAQVNNNPWQYGTLAPTSPLVTFDYDSYHYGDGLVFPTNTNGSGPAYFGPNFQMDIPEPATWALMLVGFGGVGAGVRSARRRREAAAV